jgi:hypothetical protein
LSALTQINPPPDKQWHFFITDEELTRRFGNFHIIMWNDHEHLYTFGFPTAGDDAKRFMSALAVALKNYLLEYGLAPSTEIKSR